MVDTTTKEQRFLPQLKQGVSTLKKDEEAKRERLLLQERGGSRMIKQRRWLKQREENAKRNIMKTISDLVRECYQISVEHGFWDSEKVVGIKRNDGEMLALIHSEISEALEAFRSNDPPSEKIPGFSQVEEELADVLIRVFDMAGGRGFDLEGALLAKIEYNRKREYKHGRRF